MKQQQDHVALCHVRTIVASNMREDACRAIRIAKIGDRRLTEANIQIGEH